MLFGTCVATTPTAKTSPTVVAKPATFESYSIGDLQAPRPGGTRPALMLLGGGDWPVDGFRWFMAAAGNGHIVILRASGSDDLQQEVWQEIGGALSLQTVVFHDRAAADDPAVLAIVRQADGIFLGGGDQSNYVNYWRGTALNRALEAHVRAGKPLGGTSAGLAILGRYSYGAMDGDSMDSPRALADPMRGGITLIDGFLDLPGLESVITDSHFTQRNRLGRLVVFLARLAHDQGAAAAGVVGLGIDEQSGVLLEPDGSARVVSRKGGRAWLVEPTSPAQPLVAGLPLTQQHIRVTAADGSSILRRKELGGGKARWEVEAPALVAEYDASDGQLRKRRTDAERAPSGR
jgi:cyanophycinase